MSVNLLLQCCFGVRVRGGDDHWNLVQSRIPEREASEIDSHPLQASPNPTRLSMVNVAFLSIFPALFDRSPLGRWNSLWHQAAETCFPGHVDRRPPGAQVYGL